MDHMTYRQELQQVRYTDAGRAALVERLMDAQTEQPGQGKRWGRRGIMAVLAAVLLVTAAAAVTAPLWTGYFGNLDEQQQTVVKDMETNGLPAAEADGVTITPLSILGSKNQLYMMLEIRAPEGTVFTEDGSYLLSAVVKPKVTPAEFAGYTEKFTVLEAGTREPNVLTGVYKITSSCDLGGGTLEVWGLHLQKEEGRDEWIFEGEWEIPLPGDLTGNQVLEPEAAGVTVETEQGTFTLDTVSVSPLGLWWQYRFDGTHEPVIHASLKMKDGTIVEPTPGQMIMGRPGGSEAAAASFEKPVDLSQTAALCWGNVEIPLDGQGEITAAEDVPVISDEPPFEDQPAGREETEEDESAAQPEKSADTGTDSGAASSPDRSDAGSETTLRHTDTGVVITAKSDDDGVLTASQQRRHDYYMKTLSLSDCEMIYNEPVTDQFDYKDAPYGDVCFGIDYLTFAEDGYARVSYWSHHDGTGILAVYKDENGDTWGRAFRVPEELVWTGD